MKWILASVILLGALAGVALAAAPAQASEPPRSESPVPCDTCHGRGNLTLNLPNGEKLPLKVNPASLAASVHNGLSCTDCHQSLKSFPHPQATATSVRDYELSQEVVCQTCHTHAYKQMQASVHSRDSVGDAAATCTDCHGAHDVADPTTASSRLMSISACNSCHADRDLMSRFGISTSVVETYQQDFHGKSAALLAMQKVANRVDVAVCADCHGVHDIQKAEAPTSLVSKANLPETCAKCHAGASEGFAAASLIHREASISESPLVLFARMFYKIMIPFILAGLLVHVLVDLVRGHLARRGN